MTTYKKIYNFLLSVNIPDKNIHFNSSIPMHIKFSLLHCIDKVHLMTRMLPPNHSIELATTEKTLPLRPFATE